MSALLARDELGLWIRYVYEISGISLDESKGYLVETRLSTLLKETGAGTYTELHRRVKADATNTLRRKVINAITTNETSFFRDTSPFDLLRHKLIPELIDRRTKAGLKPIPIRIWSAACSTGQEAYSTGIVLKELLGDLRNYDIRILGTDISDNAVALASYAMFSRLELDRGMSPEKLNRFFRGQRRQMEGAGRDSRHGDVPQHEPADAVLVSNAIRHCLLPKRGDLFQ